MAKYENKGMLGRGGADTTSSGPLTRTYTRPRTKKAVSAFKTPVAGNPQADYLKYVASAAGAAPQSTGGHTTMTASQTPNPPSAQPVVNNNDPNGSTSMKGFASRYAPGELPILWNNPNLIARDIYGEGPLYEDLRDNMQYAMPLYTLLHGLTNDTKGAGASDATINWAADYAKQLGTPGGQVPDYSTILNQILGAKGKDTILGEILNSGGSQDQVNTLMQYLRAGLSTGTLNPITQSAVLSQANDQADAYLDSRVKGKGGYTGNFNEWLNSGGHRLFR